MSQALQRVVVRMLHDPNFATAVFAGTTLPELTETERSMLRKSDPRAYRTDPYRRSRTLQALIEELPCAVALASDGGRALGRVDAFLSSAAFHSAIQQRRSLAVTLGGWLAPLAPGVAAFEQAVAQARRRRRPRGPGLALATGVAPVALPGGTLARWQHLQDRLGSTPLASLVAGTVQVGEVPALTTDTEHWVVVHGADGQTRLTGSAEGTHDLLRQARGPAPRAVLLAWLATQGADEPTSAAVLDDLVADGLLA